MNLLRDIMFDAFFSLGNFEFFYLYYMAHGIMFVIDYTNSVIVYNFF